jgi:hypothetical protein
MSLAAERKWLCDQVGADCISVRPDQPVFVSPMAWWGYPLVLAHVGDEDGSHWVVCSGHTPLDKKAYRLDASSFAQVRPDLSLVLGLPVGWVVTTDPVDVRYSPEIAARVAKAMDRCQLVGLSTRDSESLRPAVT